MATEKKNLLQELHLVIHLVMECMARAHQIKIIKKK